LSSAVSGVYGVAAALFATLFPSDCRLCGAPLLDISRLPVCEECLASMHPIAEALCSICGERLSGTLAFAENSGEARCGLCRRLEPPFVKAAAYGGYDGGLRELIHLLKYDHVRPAAGVLGRMLSEAIADMYPLFSDATVLVVPVPLHAGKLRQRSFNQAEIIAQSAIKQSPLKAKLELASKVLERRRETQSQIGLSRHQRRENMRGAFAVRLPDQIQGREVLVIDDVFTTGTTVSECARVLLRAGASRIFVATVARTLKAEAQFATLPVQNESASAMAAAG
jgi:ComF family protein